MNRAEHLARLGTEPATDTQVGAIHGEFRRLGLEHDRAARLEAVAALLGLDRLTSLTDLTMGQAGRLVGLLRTIETAGQLAARSRVAAGARAWVRAAEILAGPAWPRDVGALAVASRTEDR